MPEPRTPLYVAMLDTLFAQYEQKHGHPVDVEEIDALLVEVTHSPEQLERMRKDLRDWIERRNHSN